MHHNLHQAQSHDILRSWQSQRNDINHHKDFVLPMFIGNDDDSIEPIESMPEVFRYGGKRAIEYLEPLVYSFGLRAVLLFPVVTKRDKAKLGAREARQAQSDFAAGGSSSEAEVDDEVDRLSSNSSWSSSSSSSPSSSSSSSLSSTTEAAIRAMTRVWIDKPRAQDQSASPPASASEPAAQSHAPEAATALYNGASQNAQNPFIVAQNDDEDHLLAPGATDDATTMPPPPPSVPARAIDLAMIKERDNHIDESKVTKTVTKTQDVRLIKGMALKDKHNPVLRLIPKLRAKFPSLLIICDVCLCAFTSTGHCCLFEDHARAKAAAVAADQPHHHQGPISVGARFPISNKSTCHYLAMLAVEYALRGCDVVAPSDMMDGRILTIREKLNELGLNHVSILSYSAKFASAFYGPFRQATNNAPEFGDRRAYQLPPGSRALALKAVQRDISQGADFVMVKPAGPYLDIVRDIREQHPEMPVAVYQVSGEYSMLKMAASAGVIDLKLAVREMLTAYRRAGATIIISYFTPDLLKGELMIGGE